MRSLTMEDPPTMAEQVLTPLHSLETSFNALLTSLTTTPSYSAAPSATQSLLTADESLTTALQILYTHQQNYARILHLRAEAQKLEEQIKNTIRTCVDLRKEIGDIHPSILSHSDDDSDDSGFDDGEKDIDYATLLSLASKIGKHNTAAAKEAEEESIRRLIQARREKERSTNAEVRVNGNASTVAAAAATSTGAENGEATSQNLIPQHEKDWLDAEAAMARARSGMAFPAAENLRRGALGKLQWVREQGGEEAVEREVERMIAESEGRRPNEDTAETTEERGAQPVVETAARAQQGPGSVLPSRPQQQQQQATRAPPERKKSAALDLDLWNEDDEDDE